MPFFSPGGRTLDIKSATQVWTAALGQLEVEIPRPSYETWLKDTTAYSPGDGVLTVVTPNDFTAEMLSKRLSASIERVVERVASEPLEIRFTVRDRVAGGNGLTSSASAGSHIRSAGAESPAAVAPAPGTTRRLRQEFTFENYVPGPSNQLAYAAALQIAESPGAAFNPLYMYSKVGLGKTHLMHAIGHELIARGLSVIYVSAEQFTNDYIQAIRNKATDEFRTRYRSVDALLVDDIQFITSKPQTQEGFFHTFNELHISGRQLVISGDTPPEKINIEQRIHSRLTGGLTVDIQPPDYETRYAILQKKAECRGCKLPDAVLDVLAAAPVRSVRDLEGGLNRVIAFAQLTRATIDVHLAEEALSRIGASTPREFPKPEAVLAAVSANTGIPEQSITGKRRDRRTSSARHMAAYIMREECKLTAAGIGSALGGKDHSSILYALRRFQEGMASSPELRRLVGEIRRSLG